MVYRKKAIPLQRFQQLVGNLCHTSFGILTEKGLFTPLRSALKGDKPYINFSSLLLSTLLNWRMHINITLQDPVKPRQLFPREPDFLGECDACQYGIGGIWLQDLGLSNPVVWCLHLPEDVLINLVTAKNKNGNIFISDLELAAHLFYYIVLKFLCPLKHCSIGIFSNNTPTVAWTTHLCAKNSIIIGHLLRVIALRHHVSKSSLTVTAFKKGALNTRADNTSSWFSSSHNTHDLQKETLSFTHF